MYKEIIKINKMKNALEKANYPLFAIKISDLINRFRNEGDEEMVKTLDDILVDVMDYYDKLEENNK
tara:strand:- start:187 stop:384 length:198 start_codon:yes stop_codon:yes gene_type:complete